MIYVIYLHTYNYLQGTPPIREKIKSPMSTQSTINGDLSCILICWWCHHGMKSYPEQKCTICFRSTGAQWLYIPRIRQILLHLFYFMGEKRVVHRFKSGFTVATYISIPNYHSKERKLIIFESCSDNIETRVD